MQFAAFTRRTFLTVSFPGVLFLPIAAQTNRSAAAAVSAKPETVGLQNPPNQGICHGNR
jgi:hypothetical protein